MKRLSNLGFIVLWSVLLCCSLAAIWWNAAHIMTALLSAVCLGSSLYDFYKEGEE